MKRLLLAALLIVPVQAAAQGVCVMTKGWGDHKKLETQVGFKLPPSWLWGPKVCVQQEDGEVLCWNYHSENAPPCSVFAEREKPILIYDNIFIPYVGDDEPG